MAKITLCLVKDDIKTRPIGYHFEIEVNDFVSINLTPDSAEELRNDIDLYLNELRGRIDSFVKGYSDGEGTEES